MFRHNLTPLPLHVVLVITELKLPPVTSISNGRMLLAEILDVFATSVKTIVMHFQYIYFWSINKNIDQYQYR